jgi:hypothetical protein
MSDTGNTSDTSDRFEIDPVTVSNVQFRIYVSTQGEFYSSLRDQEFSATSVPGLKEKLETALRRGRIQIRVPYMRLSDTGQLVRCAVTGKHAATGAWLTNVGSRSGIQEHYLRRELPVLDEDAAAEAVRLQRALCAAQDALAKFTREHEFDLRSAAEQAWKDAGQ